MRIFSRLPEMQKELSEGGFYRLEVHKDWKYIPDEVDKSKVEIYLLDNFYIDPECRSREVVMLCETGRVKKAYLSKIYNEPTYLHPLLLGKKCGVVLSKDRRRVIYMEVFVDVQMYCVLEKVHMNRISGFELAFTGEYVEEPYWKSIVSWRQETNCFFALQEEWSRSWLDEDEVKLDLLTFEPLDEDKDSEIDLGLEFFGFASPKDMKLLPYSLKSEEVLKDFPDWIPIYEASGLEPGEEEQFVRLGYEEELYIDRLIEPVLEGERELRLSIGKKKMTYFIETEIPIYTTMAHLAPIRMEGYVTTNLGKERRLRITQIEMYKSKHLRDMLSEYFEGVNEFKTGDMLEFFDYKR